MIVSFGNRATSDLFHGVASPHARRIPHHIKEVAIRKLDLLNAAQSLEDLKSPPGNRLELLKGNFAGLHSLRINNQWRIVFRWHNASAHHVQITDYH
jgi:proteic killer suppression protein